MSTITSNAVYTYKLSADGKQMTCYGCGRTSNYPYNVEKHYCEKCHVFHDLIPMEQRKMWLAEKHPMTTVTDRLSDN
jgi:ribosomal protein L37E